MTQRVRFLCGLISALALTAPAGADEANGALPRYKLAVGQEIAYHGTSSFKYETGSFDTKIAWKIWVVRANDDGSWRLILRSSSQMTRTQAGAKLGGGPEDVTLAYCDLFPDGRIVSNDSFGFRLDPTSIFPRLPKDGAEAKDGWTETDKRQSTRTEFQRPAGAADADTEWVFESIQHSPSDKIYLSSHKARYVFSTKRLLVTRVDTENAQGYGFKGKGSGTDELTSVETTDADQAAKLAAESVRYFEASKAYEDLLEKAGKHADEVDALLARAESTLKDARAALTLPLFCEQLDERLKKHKEMASYYTEEAKNRAAVLGQVAAAWQTTDIDGKPHALKDYRGKVVILDFWYRGCGWCIRAMPQVKELADDFKNEPVAVLGMNTDKNEQDARLVIAEMGLKYPTLKAEGLPEKYHVRGFPTLIIIDQEGKVADVHVGYSPNLREDVSQSIKRLLSKR